MSRISIAASLAVIGAAGPARAGDDCIARDAWVRATLAADGASLRYCGDEPCWTVDLATGAWRAGGREALPELTAPGGSDDRRVAAPGDLIIAGDALSICDDAARAQCRRWKRPDGYADVVLRTGEYALDAADPDRLAIGNETGDSEHGGIQLALIELATGATSEWFTRSDDVGINGVDLVDGALLAHVADCTKECAARTWIFAARGGRLRKVGVAGGERAPFATDQAAPVRVGPHRVALHDATGRGVAVHDTRTGRVVRRIALRAGDVGHSVEMIARGDQLVLWGEAGFVAVVDPRRGTSRTFAGPRCAK